MKTLSKSDKPAAVFAAEYHATPDCTIAAQLIKGFQYDSDAVILKAVDRGMTPVIKRLRKYSRSQSKKKRGAHVSISRS